MRGCQKHGPDGGSTASLAPDTPVSLRTSLARRKCLDFDLRAGRMVKTDVLVVTSGHRVN
jgi:hypothetical protein